MNARIHKNKNNQQFVSLESMEPGRCPVPRGKLFIILGPSGSGKGTVIQALRKGHPKFFFPLSCTTRPPRPHERDGEVYHFVTEQEFDAHIAAGDFLEWAVVHHDYRYGTLKQPIIQALNDGKVVIREVDVQGLDSLRKIFLKDQIFAIFITTPSWEILQSRILRRSAIDPVELEKRRQSFLKEMEWAKLCDAVVQSDEGKIDEAISAVENLITKNSL